MASHTWYRPGVPKGHKDPWGYLRNRRDAKFWVKQRNISLDDIQISDTVYGDRTWFWRPSQRKAKPSESEQNSKQKSDIKDEPVKRDSDVLKASPRPGINYVDQLYSHDGYGYPEKWTGIPSWTDENPIDPKFKYISGVSRLRTLEMTILLTNPSHNYPCSVQYVLFWASKFTTALGTTGDFFRNVSANGTLYKSHRTMRNPAYIDDPNFVTLDYGKVILLADNDNSSGRHQALVRITRSLLGLHTKIHYRPGFRPEGYGVLGMVLFGEQYLPPNTPPEGYTFRYSAFSRTIYQSQTLIPIPQS